MHRFFGLEPSQPTVSARIEQLQSKLQEHGDKLNQLNDSVEQQQVQIHQLEEMQAELRQQISHILALQGPVASTASSAAAPVATEKQQKQIQRQKQQQPSSSTSSAPSSGTSTPIPLPGRSKSHQSIRKPKFIESLGTIVGKNKTEEAFKSLQTQANTVLWTIIVSYRAANATMDDDDKKLCWVNLPDAVKEWAIAELERIADINIESDKHWMANYLLNDQLDPIKWDQEAPPSVKPDLAFTATILQSQPVTKNSAASGDMDVPESSTSAASAVIKQEELVSASASDIQPPSTSTLAESLFADTDTRQGQHPTVTSEKQTLAAVGASEESVPEIQMSPYEYSYVPSSPELPTNIGAPQQRQQQGTSDEDNGSMAEQASSPAPVAAAATAATTTSSAQDHSTEQRPAKRKLGDDDDEGHDDKRAHK